MIELWWGKPTTRGIVRQTLAAELYPGWPSKTKREEKSKKKEEQWKECGKSVSRYNQQKENLLITGSYKEQVTS